MRRIITVGRRRQRGWRTNSSGMASSSGAREKASILHSDIPSRERRSSMSTSTVASVSCWVQDVLRTKRLSPPNPILESLPSAQAVLEGLQSTTTTNNKPSPHLSSLPQFSILQPHHLEKAAEEISRQHDVELAQLEVRWTSVSEEEDDVDDALETNPSSLCARLLDLDRLTAPVAQLREVSDLYETLASPPDQIQDWMKASESLESSKATHNFLENLYRSRIVYRALATASSEPAPRAGASSRLVPFFKRGAHVGIDVDVDPLDEPNASADDAGHAAEAARLQELQEELWILNDRLDKVVSYDRASKAMRLQCMSDMYNGIGLSRLQAESLLSSIPFNASVAAAHGENSNSVWGLARLQHRHMVESPHEELLQSLFPELARSLKPFLPKQAKLELEGVGAFLEGKSEVGNAINSGIVDTARASLKAKYDFQQRMRLHGVLQGFIDFCDQILGIVIVQDTEANNGAAGWSKNVRLLHLYQKGTDAAGEEHGEEDPNRGDYLGTIYFDPFADSYWRTEDAKDLVKTRLFSQQATGQTTAPVAVVALKITPIWDDTPVPMTWRDTRDLLQQLGRAIQLVLDQSRQQTNYPTNNFEQIHPAPIDTNEFLGHFFEMWLQNDGFLHRLAQLSQDELTFDEETLKTLRKDLRNEKALELTNTMFLSALQFTVFESFDPRGDETLVALQERLAVQYLPASNLPDPSDLSPLLAVFQESGIDQKMSVYGTLWSEVLASTVYETFQKTDLRDKQEVETLGTGIRDLFLRGRPPSRKDFADLCKTSLASIGSGGPLKRVYGFESETNNTNGEGKDNLKRSD